MSLSPPSSPVPLGAEPGAALVHVPGGAEHAAGAILVARESLRARLLCFARTQFVGFWANVVDFALLAACVRWLHIEAMPSRTIALVLSGVLTFIGSRSFVFRVQGGSVPRQAGRFIAAELAGLVLNLVSFRLCALCAPLAAPELVSFVANALVFVGFSYPVRRLLVFSAG
jgi:putative flippase GtrA